jgi:NAD(P)-dependent dehydrogenase (short-subunit alcohol dehydrogenase family)
MCTPSTPVNRIDEGPRVWFITGTSSGFGGAIAEAVLTRGERQEYTTRCPIATTRVELVPHQSTIALLV